jgi:hypothetical protein
MGHTGVRSFIINGNFRKTGFAGTRNGETGRFNAGNGRYLAGTLVEITGRYRDKDQKKG